MRFWDRAHKYLLWLVVIAWPWQLRHTLVFADYQGQFFEHASISLYLTDILILGMVLMWGVALMLERRKINWGPVWVSVPATVLVGWMWTSLIWAPEPIVAAWAAGHWSVFALMYLYIINNVRHIAELQWPLALGVALQGGLAIAQYFANHSLGVWWLGESVLDAGQAGIPRVIIDGVAQLRAHGTLPHANLLGGYLAIALAMMLGAWKQVRQRWMRWVWLVAYGLGGVGLLLSLSRSAVLVWVLAVTVVLVYWLVRERSLAIRIIKTGWLALAAMLLVIVTQWPVMVSRLDLANRLEQNSITTRLDQVGQFVEVFNAHKLLGVGIGQYQLALRDVEGGGENVGWRYNPSAGGWMQSDRVSVWRLEPVHNMFLMVVADLGVVGLVAVVWWLAGLVWQLWRTARRQSQSGAAVMLVVGLATLTLGLSDHYLWTLQQGRLLLWLVVALATVSLSQTSYNREDGRNADQPTS